MHKRNAEDAGNVSFSQLEKYMKKIDKNIL